MSPTTAEESRDVTSEQDDGGELSRRLPPRLPPRAAAFEGDPVEAALSDGVRALADAMARAPADALPAIAERMALIVGELKARREARAERAPAGIVDLSERRKR